MVCFILPADSCLINTALVKKRLAEEEARDEEEFRVAMMEKFSRDDRLEQMNAARRRMKVQEHKRAVLALIEEREQRRAFEKQQEMTEFETSKAREAARRQIVEEERQKILREHAIRLLGYLPKGVIRTEDDLDELGDDFKETYRSRGGEQEPFYGTKSMMGKIWQ